MSWYLPVLLLVVFRPNLENRVAMLVLSAAQVGRCFTDSARGSRLAVESP
jgi:hypothetical protein